MSTTTLSASEIDGRGFDAVVVGAGPAGSTAAIALLRNGFKVALVDRYSFPRDKACGDVIGPKARILLQRIGVVAESSISIGDMDLELPGRLVVHLPAAPGVDFDGEGMAVPRYVFDNLLFQTALKEGAIYVKGRASFPSPGHGYNPHVVKVKDGESTVSMTCTFLIGADGANSSVAERFSLLDRSSVLFGFAVRRYVRGHVRTPIISILEEGGKLFPGYGWAFPSIDGQLNVGVGVGVLGERSKGSRATKSLDPYIKMLAAREDVEIEDSFEVSEKSQMGGWLKMGLAGTKPGRYRVLLVGDAAGLVNPLQGEGIASAIESGFLAAESIMASPSDPASLYEQRLSDMELSFAKGASLLHRSALRYPGPLLPALKVLGRAAQNKRVASAFGIYLNGLGVSAGSIEGSALARVAQGFLSAMDKTIELKGHFGSL
ncbi:geranylgeranyl reductase family protein [Ferrithrix thermotolerans]|uniref:geranylgeranyl reductase family protein n=1 Tax=Ferrithrix thermotolerans TaxID=209649 RepID=UPI0009322A74|nr:geranylgeranyl reductase family protein [Ferrithrix thermotolerans]